MKNLNLPVIRAFQLLIIFSAYYSSRFTVLPRKTIFIVMVILLTAFQFVAVYRFKSHLLWTGNKIAAVLIATIIFILISFIMFTYFDSI